MRRDQQVTGFQQRDLIPQPDAVAVHEVVTGGQDPGQAVVVVPGRGQVPVPPAAARSGQVEGGGRESLAERADDGDPALGCWVLGRGPRARWGRRSSARRGRNARQTRGSRPDLKRRVRAGVVAEPAGECHVREHTPRPFRRKLRVGPGVVAIVASSSQPLGGGSYSSGRTRRSEFSSSSAMRLLSTM